MPNRNGTIQPKDHSEESPSHLFSPTATNSFPLPSLSPQPSATRRHTFTLCRPPPITTTNNNTTNHNKPTRSTPTKSSTLPNISTTSRTRTHPRNRSNPAYPALSFHNPHLSTQAHLDYDGRVHIKFNHLPGSTKDTPLSSLLDSTLKQQFSLNLFNNLTNTSTPVLDIVPPRLNIVIMVIGSRGDIQPFVALAKVLVGEWGHRVRLATHPEFKEFIEEEFRFFSVGGDPQELMAFMVKNPGLLPSLATIKAGEVARRRQQMRIMFEGFWRSCVEPSGNRLPGTTPFIADAIIANPPSFAHIHCAEKLGIPLHLMFTFPYTPTATIPHPLANISQSEFETAYTNIISYSLVELMTWQGLGDLINRFRKESLGLEPLSTLWAPGLLSRLKVPTTYMWSPSLIPKPADWGPHVDISGFVFLGKADTFTPPDNLKEFLEQDPDNPPIYIGFGSIVVDDPDGLTHIIFNAVKEAGVRALVAKGWGGLGGEDNVPEEVFMLDNTPHDWLFPKCRAVIHHGGAGTTAIGLKCGKPTFIVSFFGDQPFWGQMIKNAGAGDWCPFKEMDEERLMIGIRTVIAGEVAGKAAELAENIGKEGDGARNAVMSFYRALETVGVNVGIRCTILPEAVAVWRVRRTRIKLSAVAAYILVQEGKFTWKDLRLVRHTEWNDFDGPGEPLSGGAGAIVTALGGVAKELFDVPYTWYKGMKRVSEEYNIEAKVENGEIGKVAEISREIWERKGHKRENGIEQEQAGKSKKACEDQASSGNGEDEDEEHGGDQISKDVLHGTTHSLTSILRTGLRLPMDISLALAQGFHNAPRLYGDKVRRPHRITGIHSGLRAAGKEVTLGLYDTVTGFAIKPYRGAKTSGAVGFAKGVGMAAGRVVFAVGGGLAGTIGYTLKGVHKELHKGPERAVMEKIRDMRVWQGEREVAELNRSGDNGGEEVWEGVRDRVLKGWEEEEKREWEKKEGEEEGRGRGRGRGQRRGREREGTEREEERKEEVAAYVAVRGFRG
ncbi:hypothetical protein EV426DRAFT_529927 [Tirmania nivea]|nr:hypothetical protein EV426DRAFT_529927 [Tirmania nivea]